MPNSDKNIFFDTVFHPFDTAGAKLSIGAARTAVSFGAAVIALLSGCSSIVDPSVEDSSAPPSQAVTSSSSLASSEKNFSLSQKRLLSIIDEQNRLVEKLGSYSKLAGSDIISQKEKLDGMWRDYFMRNPDDFDALIIYGKYLRSTYNGDAYAVFLKADALGESAVVKHQLAACESEFGDFKEGYKHVREFVALEPDSVFYLRQAAQFTLVFRDSIVKSKTAPRAEVDAFLLHCYSHAADLSPNDREIQTQCALAYYDYEHPDWNAALARWNKVISLCSLGVEYQTALANKARVLVELNRDAEAREILKSVNLDSLFQSKTVLLEEIARAERTRAVDKVLEKKSANASGKRLSKGAEPSSEKSENSDAKPNSQVVPAKNSYQY